MKRKKGSVRLWAVVFWLLVWEGASLALAATTGGRMLLLASPVGALRRLLALAGTADFWQAVAFSTARILGGFLLACVLAAIVLCYWLGGRRLMRDNILDALRDDTL